jgi:uncharacterized integral membrane protein (TIGR00698 family)
MEFMALQPTSDVEPRDVPPTIEPPLLKGARTRQLWPGLGVTLMVAAVATILGHVAPVVGAPVLAIVGGIVISLFRQPSARERPGLAFSSKIVLQGSIVVLGTGLSFHQVVTTGASSLPVLLGSLLVALLGAALIGRWLSIDRDLRTLIGVGTGICGASAIAATNAVIAASEADVSYAIATIFTFNVVAVLTFPTIGHLLSLTPGQFGLWAGTAINDLSSVVAASSVFGHGATSYAVVVKLTRTLMIIPISVGLAFWRTRQNRVLDVTASSSRARGKLGEILPLFIGWFLLAVTLDTLGLIPASSHGALSDGAQVMITIALAAIGLSTNVRDIRRAGLKPLAMGAMLWVLVALSSLGLQFATGKLS